jgi:serine/threonine-protein kinase ULK/ATG1
VAIKSIPLSSLESTEDVNRVFGEVAILRKLKHFNIVQMLDALLLPDRICLIMEFCQGGELQRLIETEGRLPEDRAY